MEDSWNKGNLITIPSVTTKRKATLEKMSFLDLVNLNTLKTPFSMRNLTYWWPQPGHFFH